MRAILLALLLTATPATSLAEVDVSDLIEHNVRITATEHKGRDAVRVVQAAPGPEEDRLAIVGSSDFSDGSIEGYVSGDLLPEAGAQARGFVGIAFRIGADAESFEAIYLRPTNARADDQLRRNHSVQYISFPEYPWHRLRRETPGKYETYVDMQPGEWIKYRVDVAGTTARLFINDASQPVLIVNDLKHGASSGKVGLWVGPGTNAHFADIEITNR